MTSATRPGAGAPTGPSGPDATARARRRARLGFGALVVGLACIQVWNMGRAPWWRDDEGTYVAQAWAVANAGELAHYPYWYDHPPLGWIGVGAWAWLTAGFERSAGVPLGREVAALATIVALPLLYLVARRLGISRGFAAVAVALFTLSPLALEQHRVLWLDNLATPLLLGSLALALDARGSPRRAAGAGVLLGLAVLTKETSLLLAPVILFAIADRASEDRLRLAGVAGLAGAATAAIYPLMAFMRGELLGDGISLEAGIRFQLLERGGSGSVFDGQSAARSVVEEWLATDPWLLVFGVASLPAALAMRRLRPAGLGLAILLAVLALRTGYLPTPYVVAMLPFAALCLAGVADELLRRPPARVVSMARAVGLRPRAAVAVILGLIALAAAPRWISADAALLRDDQARPTREARDWLITNAPRDAAILTDDTIWADLVEAGFSRDRVVWFYKLDLDPAVAARFPGGYQDLDYVVSSPAMRWSSGGLPEVSRALSESSEVAQFGGTTRPHSVLETGRDAE